MEQHSKRKPNWTEAELDALSKGVAENINMVKGKFSPSVTNDSKNRCWATITQSLNIEHVESEGLSEITVAEDNVETTDCAEGECSKAFSEPKEKPSKKRGNSNSQAEDHYFMLEEMKMQKVELYRMKKIKIMEEMLVLKKRSTKALEEIRDSLKADQGPLCLSPIIKIHEM
ncbi:unnamed protein product [Mytilus coruscus]|uniref:Myb/SANT-like DNA-binding domain-containing protein n=1 Tax=Mytilus coruscus TaxID=42192 RepID=A0A6J8DRH2_MYTCO|nr:unnamed protein product [Mytilus coruscus]